MLGKNKQIFTNYNRNSKFLALTVLALLFLSFIFLIFHLDKYANIVSSFIFFILFTMVVVQLREYYLNPHTFEENIEESLPSIVTSPINFIKDVTLGIKKQKKNNKLPKLINTFLVIIFFLIYGVSTPTKDNLPGFVFLVIILVSLNSLLFYFNFGKSDKKSIVGIKEFIKTNDKTLYQFLSDHLSNKENWMIGIVNFSVLFAFAVFFGINLDSYLKFIAIGFIMILINSLLLADVKNAKLYE